MSRLRASALTFSALSRVATLYFGYRFYGFRYAG